MKLHTVFITHNRLELTKRAIESYLEMVTVPHSFVVVDNGSTDGTTEWLHENYRFASYCFGENKYPGFAANFGWEPSSLDPAPRDRPAIARQVIDTIKSGSLLFAYFPDQDWLAQSRYLGSCAAASGTK